MTRRAVTLAALLAACNGGADDGATDTATDTATSGDGDDVYYQSLRLDVAVDLLFVIDNGPSMADEQQRLAAALPALVAALDDPIAALDWRIGFTTSDAGNPRCPDTTPEAGALVLSSCRDRVALGEFQAADDDHAAACTAHCTHTDADLQILPTRIDSSPDEAPRRWIERINQTPNVAGASVIAALQCYAPQGVAGCAFPAHLESMYRALADADDETSPTNHGFLRHDSVLSIVIVSDRADCSYSDEHAAIFTSNKVFWSDPDADAPTPAVCWSAGVACDGAGPTYTTCRAEDRDESGDPDAAADAAVLRPVAEYIEFIDEIERDKQLYTSDRQVLVSLIAGVPAGYADHASEIPYADAADPKVQARLGVGPGCVLGPPDDPNSVAVPPVRERQLAEAFAEDPARRNLYSACDASYDAAMADLAARIRGQLQPACMPLCARDTDPATAVLEPHCVATLDDLITDLRTPLPLCEAGEDPMGAPTWRPPAGSAHCFAQRVDPHGTATASPLDDMSPACVDDGFNVEFVFVFGAPLSPGTSLSATCELSADKRRDCPRL